MNATSALEFPIKENYAAEDQTTDFNDTKLGKFGHQAHIDSIQNLEISRLDLHDKPQT